MTDTRRQYILYLGLAGAIGVATLVGMAPPLQATVRHTRLEWGLYQILWSRKYCDQITETLSRLASHPDYIMFYRDLQRPYPRQPIQCILDRGATPIISLELYHWHHQQAELDHINTGQYDKDFRAWAQAAKKHGVRVLWRFGFEFNGNWFPWSHAPEAYVRAWRRIHGIFQEAGATNVEWVWAPNLVSCPDTPENNMHLYYPGDEYVDWIGIDGYNFGDHHDQWHQWESFETLFGGVLNDLTKHYPKKPLMIAEFASASGKPAQRATWIREAYQYLQARPDVRAVVWFNLNKQREGEQNWRIDSSPESLAAFNDTFASPH